MAARIRPRVGDVFEVRLLDGQYAYLQMVGETGMGEVVRVLAGRFRSAREDIAQLVGEPHEYMMFAEVGLLAREEYVRRVGNHAVPPHGAWTGLRYTLGHGRSGTVERRVLSDGGRSALGLFDVLPPPSERRSVPLWWMGPSLDVVCHLMASRDAGLEPEELEQWKKEHGVLKPGQEAAEPGSPDEGTGTRHFAVFAPGAKLEGVIAELRRVGFAAEVFDDPDTDARLLVITAVEPRSASINDQWDQVAAIVEAAGGEYDGWEAEAGT
jgi:hypothetical protein